MFWVGFPSVSYLFFLYWSPFLSLCIVFDSVSFNVHEVLYINPSANVFFFGDFNIHHEDWLTYFGGTDRSGELLQNLLKSGLLRWLTFLLGSRRLWQSCSFWIYFFLLTLVYVLQCLSLHWEFRIMLLSQFLLTFHHIDNGMPRFIKLLRTILRLIVMVFVIILEMFHGRISLNSVLLLLLVNFVIGFRLELIYILIKSTRSSLSHLHGFRCLHCCHSS